MNRTQIEWTDYTSNPVVGCFNSCAYCYARRQARRQLGRCLWCYHFRPHLHPERLEQPMRVKKSSLIFVCSMGELFGPWVPRQWIDTVMNVTRQCPQHTFQFLTKCPTRLAQTEFGHNCWVGTSIDSHKDLWRKEMLLKAQASVRFISFEPLLGDMGQLDLSCIDWVIIGAQTGPRAIKPESIWVQRIINDARHAGVPVFIKDNVHWPRRLREWPRVLPPLAS